MASRGGRWLLAAALLALAGPELALLGADRGLWGSALWRPWAYQNGAFWAGLLGDWRPNYALQPALMFVTYAFLHVGPGHLVGNLAVIGPLGAAAGRWLGPGRALLVALAAALAGAGAFGVLARDPTPMVGASGAAFGLAGALVARAAAAGEGRRALLLAAGLALVAAAGSLAVARVAWATHLGGALGGAGAAWALRPRGRAGGP